MLGVLIKQANWSILGSALGFLIGFFIKGVVVQSVGLEDYGLYIKGYVFITAISTFISFGLPQVILKFLPTLIELNPSEARSLSGRVVSYIIISSVVSAITLYFISEFVAVRLFQTSDMIVILKWSALYLPVILLVSILTSLYRGVIRIKEVVVYGTFISVSLRALFTLLLFQFTNKIEYFIAVEVFVQVIVVVLLWSKFSKDFFAPKLQLNFMSLFREKKLMSFAKYVFVGSVVTYAGSELLTLLVSFMLSEKEVGAYSLMLTITGVSIFLLINLNKVFAPIISKLYSENKILELKQTYQKVTFLINAITLPFVLLILFFLPVILNYFGNEMRNYLMLNVFMFISIGATLPVGSSGVFMNMAGMEKENFLVQSIKALLAIILVFLFVKEYKLIAVVAIYVFVEYFKNYLQLFIIWKKTKIHPFTTHLLLLYLVAIPVVLYMSHNRWQIDNFFLLPTCVLVVYFFITYSKLKSILKEIYAE